MRETVDGERRTTSYSLNDAQHAHILRTKLLQMTKVEVATVLTLAAELF